MITEKLNALKKLRAKAAKLEAAIAHEQSKALAALPALHGFTNVASFIKAVKAAARGKSKPHKMAKTGARKQKRTKLTPELKAKVVAAVKAKKTGAAIAKEFGISVPSVHNIKKAAGLVKHR